MADFFFYGTLCHALLLQVVAGRAVDLVPATLEGHAVYWAEGRAFPMIVAESGARAEGLLARGLTEDEVARLDYYEGGFAYEARSVQLTARGVRQDARVYFPDVSELAPGAPWRLADWVARMGDIAVLAATRFMRGYGTVPQAAARARYPSLLVEAAAELRARHAAPATRRHAAREGDVTVAALAQPYAAFFAVREYDLSHRRFDGTMSETMRRAVFVSGDAATVLPYDPVRDRVLLIEQFRAGPFGRGDAQPWMLEPIAGRIDPGETPEEAAHREAQEEAGLTLGALWKVAQYYPTPGIAAEYLYSYVGIADLPDGAAGVHGIAEEHEDIRSHVVSFDRLMALMDSGEVQNAPLILTVQWLALHRARLRAEAGAMPVT
ncbi:MAG: gamma-glutamylcyclotransferase [Paracoccaceae bacterium]|nr:gamma-glutamylcyclotransferase [Paracoccaceae bacterium]